MKRTFYLTELPSAYRNQSWWDSKSLKRAEAFLRHVHEKYRVKGKIIKVRETK